MRVLVIHDDEELFLLLSQYLAIEWPQVEVEELGTLSPTQPEARPAWSGYDVILVASASDEILQRWFDLQHAHIDTLPVVFVSGGSAGKDHILHAGAYICVAQFELNRKTLVSAINATLDKKRKSNENTIDLHEAANQELSELIQKQSTPDSIAVHRDTGKAIEIRGYKLRKKVGEGGMSTVYLAQRVEDRKEVVLKILDSKLTQDDEQLRRFMYEFSIISEFNSPYVVYIYDQGFTDDHVFIAMEYFARGDLKQRMQQGVSRHHALQILFHIACALEVIHKHGIIHRDLKPQNIMFRADGTLAVADFGISKATELPGEAADTTIMGTPFYISPEMIGSMQSDERSDLYSLGVIFYEMLTGRRPYEATSVMMLLYKHTHDPIPRLPAKHAEFQEVIDRLLAKKPENRFRSAGALIDYLVKRWHAELA